MVITPKTKTITNRYLGIKTKENAEKNYEYYLRPYREINVIKTENIENNKLGEE